MIRSTTPHQVPRRRRGLSRARTRGAALAVALMFVVAIGAIATSAVLLSSDSLLLAKSMDHDRELRYASEAALQIGKSRINAQPALLPETGYVQLASNAALKGADGQLLPNLAVNIWYGPSGSITGQFGRFASVVAQAIDARGTGAVRRLELTQESFAKYAYWTNSETNNGNTIYFANGDQLWGPVWSNDVIHILNSGATFHDQVATAQTVSGAGFGTFNKGYLQHQRPISLPTDQSLSSLQGYAASGSMSFTAPDSGDETKVLMRLEFSPADLNADGDSADANEGFIRVYKANAGNYAWLRGDWPGAGTAPAAVVNCGDWHAVAGGATLKFFPATVHATGWFRTMVQTGGLTNAAARAESSATLATIMQHANARCYLGGDPHLVAVERTAAAYPLATDRQKGGEDSTFTPTDPYGAWQLYTNTPNAVVAAARPDAKYAVPLYRGLNSGSEGVIYVGGTVGVSGVLQGQVTLYASKGTIVVLDNLRYVSSPSSGLCNDMLGMIASNNIVVADNALLDPQTVNNSGPVVKSLGSSQSLTLQGTLMALNTSFTVQNYNSGPINVNGCQGSQSGRGCLYLTGGLIQLDRGAVGLTSGEGYVKRYSYDQCAKISPPPYFPTTGVFMDNRYFEVNPVGFSISALFYGLTH